MAQIIIPEVSLPCSQYNLIDHKDNQQNNKIRPSKYLNYCYQNIQNHSLIQVFLNLLLGRLQIKNQQVMFA